MEYAIECWPASADWQNLADPAWNLGSSGAVSHFRPESSSHHPGVSFRLLYDSAGFYGRFDVQDRYVCCRHTEFNSPVCRDSCVEFFVQPGGSGPYINFEWNACGVLHASLVRVPRQEVVLLSEEEGRRIQVFASLRERPVEEVADPVDWSLAFHLPFDLFPVDPPKAGDRWRGNFYKCGDDTSHPHWASWSPVPRLDFHDPDAFGMLLFR
jgi:hypothetical protein